ncbi:Hypothetical protein I5071_83850 [Sandaracinus amylolyticus]|nr:Hypothetical protein I5071_83850 [Sandaracinus amylolyticus]
MAGTTPALPVRPSRLRVEIALFALIAIGCPGPSEEPVHRVVMEQLPAGLLSVWGTSARDVWTVGADPGDGPYVLRYDGDAWTRIATGAQGDAWWVHGFESDGSVFVGGEGGMILRWDGASFSRMETPSDTPTIFGIWGSGPDDVLAVGGLGRAAGFVWHYDGSAWRAIDLPEALMGRSLFKVWGRARGDAWIVGTDGAVLHWDGEGLTMHDAGTTRTLFTVHVGPDGSVAAVGGAGSGVLVVRDPEGVWHDVAPELVPQLFGVFLTRDDGRAVGINGSFVRREGATWVIDETDLALAETLHSVWIDPDGGVWAAGGQVLAEPLERGLLIYQGREEIAPYEGE